MACGRDVAGDPDAAAVVRMVGEAWCALGGADSAGADGCAGPVTFDGPAVTLPSPLPVTALAVATVAAAARAASELAALRRGIPRGPVAHIDSRAVAVAFHSERHLRRDGAGFGSFDPLSRFFRTADGWLRTHGNYPHHRRRLLTALGLGDLVDVDGTAAEAALAAVIRVLAASRAGDAEDAITGAGGVAAAVRTPDTWLAHPQGATVATLPLIGVRQADAGVPTTVPGHWARAVTGGGPPAAGIRVLDLTRVIAGPIGTRTLSLLGADVLRVDSPRLPEIAEQHLDTGPGKRSTLLDLDAQADRKAFDALLAEADVVVTGYRMDGLAARGLAPDALLERRPDLVVATLSAWGAHGPWAGRRGFDSLVQAGTGIAVRCPPGADGTPGTLPAQALDHGTGYLLAAAVLRGLATRMANGVGGVYELSLARTAAWLLGTDRAGGNSEADRPDAVVPSSPARELPDPSPWLAEVDTPAGRLTYALPPVILDGTPRTWTRLAEPFGASAPAWLA